MKDSIHSQVFKTYDYNKFRFDKTNRSVNEVIKTRIKKSINAIGQKDYPIVVTEDFRIIDGQHRFEVYKELNLPIYYIIDDCCDFEKTCAWINAVPTKWTTMDYIKSYAERGNEDYIKVCELIHQFPIIPIPVLIRLAQGLVGSNDIGHDQKIRISSIQTGTFKITVEYSYLIEKLIYISQLLSDLCRVGGNKALWTIALSFVYEWPAISNERMSKKLKERLSDIIPPTNLACAMSQLSSVYNHKYRGTLMDFKSEYLKWIDSKNPGASKMVQRKYGWL